MSDQMARRTTPELNGHAHSYFFSQALREDSNLASDWLWWADQVTNEVEYQYCLARAYYIDSDSVAVYSPEPKLILMLKNLTDRVLNKPTVPNGQSEAQLTPLSEQE